jgi:transposase, IS30 family
MGVFYDQLGLEIRIEIYRLHADGKSLQQIADFVGFHKSTIGRELQRNSLATKSWPGGYCAARANELAQRRRRWDCRFKLARQPALAMRVEQRLAMGWSPETISGRLALEDNSNTISKEAIHRFIYHRTAQKDYWNRYLQRGKYRRGKYAMRGGSPASFIKNRVSIASRPDEVATRSDIGHWENDCMAFMHNRQVIVFSHERHSRLMIGTRQTNKTAATTLATLLSHYQNLPAPLRRSTTFDNGTEFANHWALGDSLAMKTYFCDPHKPWQKGGIENAIGRLRRWLPSKTNIQLIPESQFNAIINRYNNTPKKCLGFKTPHEVFYQNLQPSHFNCESTLPLSRE